ncbi:MAG TPA: cobaltochelatase subunit CobN [Armatimonadetes bacterium]|nr:cobaltochelatase subunit CobN [Armatimonadota bacterium]
MAWRKRTKEGVVDLPITERIEKLARRIEAWVRLRHKPNAKKRIAIIHYDMSASYLNVPRSLMRLLMALQEHGYNVRVPASEDELLAQLKRARNVSSDDRVGLEMLYNDPNTAKVDASEYCKWFSELPKKLQGDVIKWWGKPPGKIMVWRGKLLIPQVPLGNVAIVPLPWRGESDSPDALYHNLSVPPPHHYIAFYFWLRRRFKADAVIHFGTHGTHEFLPRKQQGLSHTDYPDILIQDMPNIYPYMCVNAVEAITAKRRGYAVIISHNVPPMRTTRLSPELERLHTLIRRYESAESEALKREYRREILQQAKRAKAVGIEIRDVANFDELVRNAHAFLHRLLREEAPIGLHVLGEQPTGDALVATVLAMLHGDLERRLSEIGVTNATPNAVCEQSEPAIATALLRKTILDGESPQQAQMEVLGEGDERITELLTDASEYARRIRESDEIGAILHALEGGFIPSGIGGCPIRNPNVLPTGRNMHSIDPKTIPTKAAWAVGKRMVVQMLERYRRERGRLPRKVGFVLFGGETIRHHGVMESQILFLLGVEPIWARGGRVAGLRLIPTSQLGRPRIDVVITTTGQYRDVFGDVMKLLQRAVEMAASASDESYVREHIRALQRQLQARGMDADIARQLATIRVFAPAVGVYAAGLEAAIPATNTWRTDEKLARFYIKRMGFAYGREGAWGDEQSELFAMVLKGTDAAVFSRSSKLYGLLDTDHPFGFLGGISLAVRHLSGRSPMLFISNLRSTAQPKVETAREFMAMEANTRYLNPDWIREMMRMGFSGAGEMANWLNNLWGWQVTDSNAVDQRLWEKAYDVYVKDVYRLGLRDWMLRVRPEALRAIVRAMLNAIERGYWKAPQGIHITLTAMLHPGKLHRIVPTARRIAVGTKVRTRSITPIAHPIARVRPATPVKPPTRPRYVLGRKLVEIPRQASSREPHIPVGSLIALASALFLIGMLRRLREQ